MRLWRRFDAIRGAVLFAARKVKRVVQVEIIVCIKGFWRLAIVVAM